MIKLVAAVSIYNSGAWLKSRLENLFDTVTYKRGGLFIYCINASSPDPRDDAIANIFAGYANYHYEITPHSTVYAAWNRSIRQTQSTYVCSANTDDLVSPDCYEILMETCAQQNVHIAYPGWYTIGDPTGGWSAINPNWDWNRCAAYYPANNQVSCGHFPVIRREVFDAVGLYDPSFRALGDADLWFRAHLAGFKFAHVQAPLAAYMWRGDGPAGNLWERVSQNDRQIEWETIYGRKPGKLEF